MLDPWPHQTFAFDETDRLVSEGARNICITSPTGGGKCLGFGTPVLMHDGTVLEVQFIMAGDSLMGPDSQPRLVSGVSRGHGPMYGILPHHRGDFVTVNSEHILSLKMTGGSKRSCDVADGSIVDISVAEYLRQTKTFRHCAKWYHVGVDFPTQSVPLDPYFLGLWLGDGSSRNQEVTSVDTEIVKWLRGFATAHGLRLVARTSCDRTPTYALSAARWRYNPVREAMKQLGLFGNKHVPMCYKANDRSVRLAVLAGIIDTDGSLTHSNGYDCVFKSLALADDTAYLARSLGLAVSQRICRKTCTNNGVSNNYWRLHITGDNDEVPTRIPRKQANPRRQKKDHQVSGFAIEELGDDDYYGFELSGDGRFLLGDFSVTHNTLIMQKRLEAMLPKDCAVYTDRIMLRMQLSKGLTDIGLDHGIRASGVRPALLRQIQLCMLQTEGSRSLDNGNREVHPADLVIIDEAHKMAAGTMTALDEEHLRLKPERIKLGFTATPLDIGHFYDELIVAGTNSELRDCGALLPAYHYAPDEPDTKWIGKVAVDGGECGIVNSKRTEYAHRVFGRVLEHIPIYNPELKPMLLFAPGVAQSKWFAQELSRHDIPSAHIAGDGIWVDGEELDATDDNRAMILERHEAGEIKCICNRFVMREGIDAPWIYHGIFATVFGSLTSYIQAGGRLLRNHPSMDRVVIQDHGGCWWRHGSLNANREWDLGYDDRIVQGLRKHRLQEKKDPEPIVCPKCNAVRLWGKKCPECGHQHVGKVRSVLQKDGSLREMRGDIYRKPRRLERTQQIEKQWVSRVWAIRKSKKDTVKGMTFSQIEANFAREHHWQYPPRTLPQMPLEPADWFRPVAKVPLDRLS